MQLHASCCARNGRGVLIAGPPGSGKSSLLLRLLGHGFRLVADDRVVVNGLEACAPPALAGILEVRGVGLVRMAFMRTVRLTLVIQLDKEERLPEPGTCRRTGLPMVHLRPHCPLSPHRISLALRIAAGCQTQVFGAFA